MSTDPSIPQPFDYSIKRFINPNGSNALSSILLPDLTFIFPQTGQAFFDAVSQES